MKRKLIVTLFLTMLTSLIFAGSLFAKSASVEPNIQGVPAEPMTTDELAMVEGKNAFPYGYCTWYVQDLVEKRWGITKVPWNSDAKNWFAQAKASKKFKTGDTPKKNSIVVYKAYWGGDKNPQGHVAFVTDVDGRNFKVTEMNVKGWGISSTRKDTTKNNNKIMGFIYKP